MGARTLIHQEQSPLDHSMTSTTATADKPSATSALTSAPDFVSMASTLSSSSSSSSSSTSATKATATAAKRQRGISFFPLVQQIASPHASKDQLSELWYQPSELAEMKLRNATLDEDGVTNKEISGLQRCASDRHRYKMLTIQCTLSAHRKKKPNMAEIARKCATYSCQLAFLQACYDYCNIYEAEYISELPSFPSVARRFPFPFRIRSGVKRSSPSSSSRSSSATTTTTVAGRSAAGATMLPSATTTTLTTTGADATANKRQRLC